MADSESRYFWLKLQRDFFKRHDVRIVEGMPNGKDYILFYLKLLCESIDHEGYLRFSDTIPYNEQMLSTITDTNIDIVRSAVKVFSELGLMEILNDGTYYMVEVEKMIGSKSNTAGARRQDRFRERKKLRALEDLSVTESNACVTVCVTEDNESKSKNKSKSNNNISSSTNVTEDISSDSSSTQKKSGKVPYQKILEMYYELCPSMSKVRPVNKYTDEIKRNVKARYAEYTLEDFTTVFKKAEASDFLNNRADVTFQASFDWLMRPKNFSKALNGNFDNIAKKPKETIKGTNIAMSIVADGTREDSPEPEVRFE